MERWVHLRLGLAPGGEEGQGEVEARRERERRQEVQGREKGGLEKQAGQGGKDAEQERAEEREMQQQGKQPMQGEEGKGDGIGGIPASTLDELAEAIESLRKRRGSCATSLSLRQLRAGELSSVVHSMLDYYDALYDDYALRSGVNKVVRVACAELSHAEAAEQLIELYRGGGC
ncbi:MAG: hypothetical protein SGPRY_013780 [Prymnesium sp.]